MRRARLFCTPVHGRRRRRLRGEAAGDLCGNQQIAAASEGLPDGWAALLSRSEPREIFYHHSATKTTQLKRPAVEVDPSSVLVEPEAC